MRASKWLCKSFLCARFVFITASSSVYHALVHFHYFSFDFWLPNAVESSYILNATEEVAEDGDVEVTSVSNDSVNCLVAAFPLMFTNPFLTGCNFKILNNWCTSPKKTQYFFLNISIVSVKSFRLIDKSGCEISTLIFVCDFRPLTGFECVSCVTREIQHHERSLLMQHLQIQSEFLQWHEMSFSPLWSWGSLHLPESRLSRPCIAPCCVSQRKMGSSL